MSKQETSEHNTEEEAFEKKLKAALASTESRTKLSTLSEEEKVNRHKEQMKEWRKQHPDYNKTYRQRYYEEHREEILSKRRQKRAEHKRILDEAKKVILLPDSEIVKRNNEQDIKAHPRPQLKPNEIRRKT
jgi:hypothetical protein